jgi:hypothetical protein
MSYDIHLYTNNTNKPKKGLLNKKDLEKLRPRFTYEINDVKEDGKVVGFFVDYSERFNKELPEDNFEVYYQGDEKGFYWIYISYGAYEKAIKPFIDFVSEIASTLNLKIQDPQISNKIFTPEEYRKEVPQEAKKVFRRQKEILDTASDRNVSQK